MLRRREGGGAGGGFGGGAGPNVYQMRQQMFAIGDVPSTSVDHADLIEA
jgi:hypothetical protein